MDRQSFLIGADRVFLAQITNDDATGISYDTPFAIPGATEVAVTMNNTKVTIYADDGAYENVDQQGDIDVAVSLAGLGGQKRADITGGVYNASNGTIEYDGTGVLQKYALGYRRQKANGSYRYMWFLKGSFSRPDSTAATKSGSTAAQPMQYKYRALNRAYDMKLERTLDSDNNDLPVGLTDAALNDTNLGWFSSPDYVAVAPGTPIADVVVSTGASAGQISLAFSAPSGADSAKAQVETIGGFVDATTVATITAVSTSAVITGLVAGNTYNCRLVVVGGESNGISNADSASAGA
jgi:phi13 family phage major tail protein